MQDTDGPEAVGGFDDQYDMDDDWIDDSEHLAYYDGDRRKAKYSGFFINKVLLVVVFMLYLQKLWLGLFLSARCTLQYTTVMLAVFASGGD